MDNFGDNIEVFHMDGDEFVHLVEEEHEQDCPSIRTGRHEDCACGAVSYEITQPGSWMGIVAQELLDAGTDIEDIADICEGWYWWYCFPGCMPESDAYGPSNTEEKAFQDYVARWLEDGGNPIPITLSTNDDHEQTPEGWMAHVTVYTNRYLAMHDQSVHVDGQGSRWETPEDMSEGYCMLHLSGPGEYTFEAYEAELDKLREQLESNGYSIESED